MADTKTSAETAASALDGTELIRGVQSAANVRLTPAQIKTYIFASYLQYWSGGNGSVEIRNTADDAYTNIRALTFFSGAAGYRMATAYLSNAGDSLELGSVGWRGVAQVINLEPTAGIAWNSTGLAAPDLYLQRAGVGNLRIGTVASATPAACLLTIGGSSRSGTDSNVAGANGTIQPGLGTGTGTLAKLLLQGVVIAAGGTGAQTYATAISINSTTATGLQFNGYGAGTITSDGSGNLTAASDPRMKNIQREYTPGLAELSRIKPIVYKWRKDSGMEPDSEYAGFDALNVRGAVPMATWEGKDGMLSLQDRALLAACVNAINELAAR